MPGLVTLYTIWPRNGMGLFLKPQDSLVRRQVSERGTAGISGACMILLPPKQQYQNNERIIHVLNMWNYAHISDNKTFELAAIFDIESAVTSAFCDGARWYGAPTPFTSPARAVAKYCDKCICLCVCLTGYLRNLTRNLYQIFVHVAYVRGSVFLRHVDDRPHRLSAGRGDVSAQRGRSVISDCPVSRCWQILWKST